MIIAGNITATTVDLALVKQNGEDIKLFNQASYLNQDFSDFNSILKLYLKNVSHPLDLACFGVAGPVINCNDATLEVGMVDWNDSGTIDAGEDYYDDFTLDFTGIDITAVGNPSLWDITMIIEITSFYSLDLILFSINLNLTLGGI